ncbi:MAG: glutathione S-transferase family protein [Hyphococcus sp.]
MASTSGSEAIYARTHMTEFTLTIGDKNLSSWSLRAWLVLKQAGIPFAEDAVKLDQPETRAILAEKTPSGLVPCLTHRTDASVIQIWDSLAIAEYINDCFPEKQLWPAEPPARAMARSVAAEMHSGFSTLRALWPMQFIRKNMRHLTAGGVEKDILRINRIWTECRIRFGESAEEDAGFLFGAFSIADAMYAPVVSRFVTYGPVAGLSPQAAAYCDLIFDLPAMREWGDGAALETSDRLAP